MSIEELEERLEVFQNPGSVGKHYVPKGHPKFKITEDFRGKAVTFLTRLLKQKKDERTAGVRRGPAAAASAASASSSSAQGGKGKGK